MGILRTDKISGLETPTAVTGSVSFDGTDDALIIADHGDTFDFSKNDFTVECWIYPRGGGNSSFGGIWSKGQSYQLWWKEDTERIEVFASSDGSNYDILNGVNSGDDSVPANQWSHIAHTREGDTFRIFVNGILLNSATSSSTILANTNAARISDYDPDTGKYELDGEISNLRVLKGTALYTADFTPPTHALEVINDTIILCCNNPDSVTASAFAGIGTAYAITTAGNPTVATRDPGLTRDFTYGTEFKGVTTFDTQGYFVPPSGTTEQRGRGRGVFGAGYVDPGVNTTTISYIEIQTQGNAQDFGDLTSARRGAGCVTNLTRGVFMGGVTTPTITNIMDFVTISSTGNAVDFGDAQDERRNFGGVASNTRGVFGNGINPSYNNTIDFITIGSLGTTTDFGDSTVNRGGTTGNACSPTRGLFAGGYTPGPTSSDTIEYITIATTGNATDFGNLTTASRHMGGVSSSVRGAFSGGNGPSNINTINYVTIATTGNAQDFGDLTQARENIASASNSIRGVFFAGISTPTQRNTIDFVTIATTGDAVDFGDAIANVQQAAGGGDSHGGLS